jgi:hypothetical protein
MVRLLADGEGADLGTRIREGAGPSTESLARK